MHIEQLIEELIALFDGFLNWDISLEIEPSHIQEGFNNIFTLCC